MMLGFSHQFYRRFDDAVLCNVMSALLQLNSNPKIIVWDASQTLLVGTNPSLLGHKSQQPMSEYLINKDSLHT